MNFIDAMWRTSDGTFARARRKGWRKEWYVSNGMTLCGPANPYPGTSNTTMFYPKIEDIMADDWEIDEMVAGR
jgi:hypothetical protein